VEVRIVVDGFNQGRNYTVNGNKEEVIETITKELDDAVAVVKIQKMPAQKEPAEKQDIINCFSDNCCHKEH